jgi:hypothetical protein
MVAKRAAKPARKTKGAVPPAFLANIKAKGKSPAAAAPMSAKAAQMAKKRPAC